MEKTVISGLSLFQDLSVPRMGRGIKTDLIGVSVEFCFSDKTFAGLRNQGNIMEASRFSRCQHGVFGKVCSMGGLFADQALLIVCGVVIQGEGEKFRYIHILRAFVCHLENQVRILHICLLGIDTAAPGSNDRRLDGILYPDFF